MWVKDADTDLPRPFSKQIKAVLKLAIILLSYTFAFVTMVRFGFWTYEARFNDADSLPVWRCFDQNRSVFCQPINVLALLCINFGLLMLFGLQHTFMTQRKLISTKYWDVVHYSWEIDKAIYNLLTALVLQCVMSFWQPSAIYLWKIPSPDNYLNTFFILHVIAWGVFYGTNLMIDFPDLIGLNQVIIECPNQVAKSPDLQTMIENQRHMGFLPLAIILLVHPCMSLDRMLLTSVVLSYTYFSWKSHSCYPYAKSMRRVKTSMVYDHDD